MDKLTKSLSETIENSDLEAVNQELEGIFLDTGEDIIDETLHILDELPVLKTLLAIPKIFKGISNHLLTKKIIRFLMQLDTIPIAERKKFLKDLYRNTRKEIIENLMLILEKHDNYQKSEIQGKIFKAFIEEKINKQEYDSLTYATGMINPSAIAF